MNWGLISPQFYGLLLFLGLAVGALFAFALGIFWLLYQINKSRNADLDAKIRSAAKAETSSVESQLNALKQSTESQHRETMTALAEMEKRLPKSETVNDHDTRLGKLESRTCDHRSELDELFRRMRKMEIAHASQHGAQAEEHDTTMSQLETIPPSRRS